MTITFCPHCETKTVTKTILKPETLPVAETQITYIAELTKCLECENEFATNQQEINNFKVLYETYFKRK